MTLRLPSMFEGSPSVQEMPLKHNTRLVLQTPCRCKIGYSDEQLAQASWLGKMRVTLTSTSSLYRCLLPPLNDYRNFLFHAAGTYSSAICLLIIGHLRIDCVDEEQLQMSCHRSVALIGTSQSLGYVLVLQFPGTLFGGRR